ALQKLSVRIQPRILADTPAHRAYPYYQLIDLFGAVPIVTSNDYKPHARSTRAALFAFIATELKAARPDLPAQSDHANRARMTKGAAAAILANMYINAAVFTKDVGIAVSYNDCATVQLGSATDW